MPGIGTERNRNVARSISAGVPTEVIRDDVYLWPSLMAATAFVAVPLGISHGLLLDYLARAFPSSGRISE